MSNPEDYTVGWICAIEPEYLAAQLCLDETHPNLTCRPSPDDTNTYVLGKISDHNVVIACLLDGSYGISSAAKVATNMLRSFPNVRVGLMVGIGGAAPTPDRDIRLGDIMVSSPGDGKGGVFQVEYKRYPGNLEKAIYSVLDKEEEELREELDKPDAITDTLYRSHFVHPVNNNIPCAQVCGMDPANTILRPERTKRPGSPVVHYGLIASGNQLMKDALRRDELAGKWKVLCFEMEAAGLMNDFPYLVVRGICDYSDSYNNKVWQGYTAVAAAVYTKGLLRQMSPDHVKAEKKATDILSAVSKDVDKLVRGQHDQEQQAILDWLTPIDYAFQHNELISRRQLGTGQWFLESVEYQAWLDRDQSNPRILQSSLKCGLDSLSKKFSLDFLAAY